MSLSTPPCPFVHIFSVPAAHIWERNACESTFWSVPVAPVSWPVSLSIPPCCIFCVFFLPDLIQQGMETGPPYIRDDHMMLTMVRARKWVHEDSLVDQGQTRVFPKDLPDRSPGGEVGSRNGERKGAPRVGRAGVMNGQGHRTRCELRVCACLHVLCLGVLSKVLLLCS